MTFIDTLQRFSAAVFLVVITTFAPARGSGEVRGFAAELEEWLRAGWQLIGQSQSSITNLSGMQAVLVAYTLSHI